MDNTISNGVEFSRYFAIKPDICLSQSELFLVYVENARSTTATTLAFTIGSTTGIKWNMKVSQIECSNSAK